LGGDVDDDEVDCGFTCTSLSKSRRLAPEERVEKEEKWTDSDDLDELEGLA
jgi:hypothetical protein